MVSKLKKIPTRGKEDLGAYKLYTLTELEPVLGVSHSSLVFYIKTGKLKAQKIAGKWRVRPADLDEFLGRGEKPDET